MVSQARVCCGVLRLVCCVLGRCLDAFALRPTLADAGMRLPGPMLEGVYSAVIDGAVTAMVAAFPAGLAPTMVAAQPKPSTTAADPVGDYVKAKGGKRAIRKILIANNGMAATKAILSMRQWAYMELGDEKLLEFVAMATPEDLNANAEFIRLADSFVEVPAGANKNNYANVDLIIKTAVEANVDAVWPGWGHASEKPALPNGLDKVGIKFIGPRGPIMYALGDKIAANILAQSAGVSPCSLVPPFCLLLPCVLVTDARVAMLIRTTGVSQVDSIPWSGSFGGPNDGPLVAQLDEVVFAFLFSSLPQFVPLHT